MSTNDETGYVLSDPNHAPFFEDGSATSSLPQPDETKEIHVSEVSEDRPATNAGLSQILPQKTLHETFHNFHRTEDLETLQILSNSSPFACLALARAYLKRTRTDVFKSQREAKKYYLNCKTLLTERGCKIDDPASLKEHLSSWELKQYTTLKKIFEPESSDLPVKLKLHEFLGQCADTIKEHASTANMYTGVDLINPIRIGTGTALTGYVALLSIPAYGPVAAGLLANLGIIYHTSYLLILFSVILKNVLSAAKNPPAGKSAWLAMKETYFATMNEKNALGQSRRDRIQNSAVWLPILVAILACSFGKAALDATHPTISLGLLMFMNAITVLGFGHDVWLVAKIGDAAVAKLEKEQQLLTTEMNSITDECTKINNDYDAYRTSRLNATDSSTENETHTCKKITSILLDNPKISKDDLLKMLQDDKAIMQRRCDAIPFELKAAKVKRDLDNSMVWVCLIGFSVSILGGSLMLAAAPLGPVGLPLFAAGLLLAAIGTTCVIGSCFAAVGIWAWDKYKKRNHKTLAEPRAVTTTAENTESHSPITGPHKEISQDPDTSAEGTVVPVANNQENITFFVPVISQKPEVPKTINPLGFFKPESACSYSQSMKSAIAPAACAA